MRHNNPLISSTVTVFGFWWFIIALHEFNWSPVEVIRNWEYLAYSTRGWWLGGVGGVGAAALMIWYRRAVIHDALQGGRWNGLVCSLGPVPMPAPPPPRVDSEEQHLPIGSPTVRAWIDSAKEEHPEHVAMFQAIWAIYSAHADWPASHRIGGHGGRRLWEHCLAVVETSLEMARDFTYKGVTIKTRGRPETTLIHKLDPEFVFNANDPLIPLLALAHDIGKLEAYKKRADGTFGASGVETGKDFDDLGVPHDALGARMLARLPEYWALPDRDWRIVNLVIAHYHHPSDFPTERDGSSLGDRMCALLQLLIRADKKTGELESNCTAAEDADEFSEDDDAEIFGAVVEIMTESGRISGFANDSKESSDFAIGAKYGELIVVNELRLRRLLLAKLNRSIEGGSGRYRMTGRLLEILGREELLYSVHNGVDFMPYLPLWNVNSYEHESGRHIASWSGCIVIKPTAKAKGLDALRTLRSKKSRMELSQPSFAHNNAIRDPQLLGQLLEQAFGEKVARSVLIPKCSDELFEIEQEDVADPSAFEPPDMSEPEAPSDQDEARKNSQPDNCAPELAAGRTIRDEDAPRGRDFTNDPKARDLLRSLKAAAQSDGAIEPGRRRKRRHELPTVLSLQKLLEQHPEAIAGERDGYLWVFQPDLNRIAGPDAFGHAVTKLLLPMHDAGNGLCYLGIPVATKV